MADTVRYLLEEMVPELEALEARGYFSRAEIRSVVQKRQDFEYAIKRMAARKDDYLRYIAYETQLDELREARRSSRGISGKRGHAEWCITRRIHFIYERATRKFRGDLDLWSRWLRFCRASRSWKQMSRVLTKALQLHSACAPLWTYAAAWEFEHNLNAGAARALMQRGLRMCKHATGLWHEYFRMELLYALRLRQRRRVLGIDDDAAGGGDGPGTGSEGEGEGDESAAAVAAVLSGAVAGVVYRSAVAAVPDSLPFRARFLDLLRPLDFPGKAALEDAIYDSVAQDFGGSPQAWDLQARRHAAALPPTVAPAARLAAVQAAVGVYERGLAAAPSTELLASLLAFLQQQLGALQQHGGGGEAAEWVCQRALRAHEEAAPARLLDEALRLDGIALLLRLGRAEAALEAARAAVAEVPASAALWQQLLQLEALDERLQAGTASQPDEQAHAGDASSSEEEEAVVGRPAAALAGTAAANSRRSGAPAQRQLEEVALRGLRSVQPADATPLWLTAIGLLCGNGCSLQLLSQQLVEAALRQSRGPVEGGLGAVAAVLLTTLFQTGGIQAARSLYRALLPLPPPGGDYWRCLLQLEVQHAAGEAAAATAVGGRGGRGSAAGTALSARQLQDLFDRAADSYGGEDVSLWLLYAEWQASRGADGDEAGVYWRARKALRQPEAFETAYLLRFKLQPTSVA